MHQCHPSIVSRMNTQLDSSLSQLNWLITKSSKDHDTEDKPNLSYSQLIKMAIESNMDQRCTLSEIYAFITCNYPYFRTRANPSWKNSIRHNLSLNKQFIRESRDKGDIGKGSYWRCVPRSENLKVRRCKPVEKEDGEGPRLNPAIHKIFCAPHPHPTESTTLSTPKCTYKSTSHTQKMCNLYTQHQSNLSQKRNPCTNKCSLTESADQNDDDLSDMNLFESLNLSASFLDLYDHLFPTSNKSATNKKVAQLDWLKASLETIGMDYANEDQVRNIDMDRFKTYKIVAELVKSGNNDSTKEQSVKCVQNQDSFINGLCLYDVNSSLNEINKDLSVVDSTSIQAPAWTQEDEDSDDFDWESLVDI